jgi:hypothetical protein
MTQYMIVQYMKRGKGMGGKQRDAPFVELGHERVVVDHAV